MIGGSKDGRAKESRPAENWALIEPFLSARGIRLEARQRRQVVGFVELLLHWNRRINLVGDAERIYSRHVLDCLVLASLPRPRGACHVVDIGSGAGLPGLLMAIFYPDWRVVSLERIAKKATFQQVAASELAIGNFQPLRRDVAEFAQSPDGREKFDVALARAFSGLGTLLQVGAELLRPGGELWAMRGKQAAQEQSRVAGKLLAPFEVRAARHPYRWPELDVGGEVLVYRRRAPRLTGV